MWRLVPALVQQMGAAYPELLRAQPLITETLRLEEEGFRQTLGRGLALLEEMAEGKGLKDRKTLDGSVAFTLYDTYGFPLDLTQDILRPRGIAVDVDGSTRRWKRPAPARAPPGSARARRRPRRPGTPCARRSGRPSSSATRPRPPRASCWRSSKARSGSRRPRPATRSASSSTRRRSTPSPAGRSATPVRSSRRERRRIGGARHAEAGRRVAPASRHDARTASCKVGDAVELRVDGERRRRAARQPFGDAPLASGAAAPPRRACDAEGLARRARPAALRFQPSAAARRRRTSRRSRPRSTTGSATMPRCAPGS